MALPICRHILVTADNGEHRGRPDRKTDNFSLRQIYGRLLAQETSLHPLSPLDKPRDRYLGNRYRNLMTPRRTVRSRILLDRRLNLSGSIGRANNQRVPARRRHHPGITPEAPGRVSNRRINRCGHPLLTTIDAAPHIADLPGANRESGEGTYAYKKCIRKRKSPVVGGML